MTRRARVRGVLSAISSVVELWRRFVVAQRLGNVDPELLSIYWVSNSWIT